MNQTIYIGTRKSELAMTQAKLVARAIETAGLGLLPELVLKQTKGDRILDKPLLEFGGKGVFVTEFEEALIKGELHLAVHSAKDLPVCLKEGLGIGLVLEREDPRDVLVTRAGASFAGKREIVIGTSSLRRQLQIEEAGQKLWPGVMVRCENLRGNVGTRLLKLSQGLYDGIILAAAGLKRLGLLQEPFHNGGYDFHFFDCENFIPAPCQGILAVEMQMASGLLMALKPLENETARRCFELERRIVTLLNAGCHEPVGVYSKLENGRVEVFGINKRGGRIRKIHLQGEAEDLEGLAGQAAQGLL